MFAWFNNQSPIVQDVAFFAALIFLLFAWNTIIED